MYNIGDTIVHNRYGAGTVVGSKQITLYGEARDYVCIELTADRGTLMVRSEDIDLDEMRRTLDDMTLIREVFSNPPEELSDQHRSRQPKLQAKLRSNDPRKVAQVLRDLMYRDRIHGLTETDKRIRDSARKKLMAELMLSPNIDAASRKLSRIIDDAIDKHLATVQ